MTTIDNGGTDAIEHIVEAQNGFIGVGYIDAVDENNTFYTEGKGYMTFFDLDGNKTSGKLLDTKMSHAYRISKINNDLIISGLTPGADDYALMKTNLALLFPTVITKSFSFCKRMAKVIGWAASTELLVVSVKTT